MLSTIWQVIEALCVAWTFFCGLTGLALLLFGARTRRPLSPPPGPPHKPFQGRLALPDVFPGPANRRRSDYLHQWIDGQDMRANDRIGEDTPDNLLMFDRSRHEASMARRLEIVRRQNEAN